MYTGARLGAQRASVRVHGAPAALGNQLATSLCQSLVGPLRPRLMDRNLIPSFIAFCATARPRIRRSFFAACVAESLAFARLRKLLTSSFTTTPIPCFAFSWPLTLQLGKTHIIPVGNHEIGKPHDNPYTRVCYANSYPFTRVWYVTVTSHRAGETVQGN